MGMDIAWNTWSDFDIVITESVSEWDTDNEMGWHEDIENSIFESWGEEDFMSDADTECCYSDEYFDALETIYIIQ